MTQSFEVVFDGTAFRPDVPPPLPPNTRGRIVFEPLPEAAEPYSALDVMMSLNLDGPPDWSANLDKYLYGSEDDRPEG